MINVGYYTEISYVFQVRSAYIFRGAKIRISIGSITSKIRHVRMLLLLIQTVVIIILKIPKNAAYDNQIFGYQ